jgi:di/tricarboxylate transporter
MGFDAWLSIAVTLACLGALAATRLAPDIILLTGLTVLLLAGVVGPAEAFAGFSNEAVITVAALYVVAAGLRDTGAQELITRGLFGRARSVAHAQMKVMMPVAGVSAFLNNTPVVATFLPAVSDWARQQRIAPSKLMIPLSYAAIFGGCCTLIGTSTNLVVDGLLRRETELPGFAFWELAWVGVPCGLAGMAYLMFVQRWLLPDRGGAFEALADPREYTVEMIVEKGSPLDGQTVEDAGLRHLPGLFLVEIDRNGHVIPAVAPEEVLRGGDRLVFAGITESVVDLQRFKGLKPATDQVFKLSAARDRRLLVEVVVSASSRIVGRTIRESRFRNAYDAVVIAVARQGARVAGKIGDIVVEPGDTLLLETDAGFLDRYRNSRDFLLVRTIEGYRHPRHERAWAAWAVIAGVIVAASFGLTSMLVASLVGAGAMLALKCVSPNAARRSLDLEVLLVIGASYGIGRALDASGAAAAVARELMALAGNDPVVLLAAIYVSTVVLTELITNNAAAVLMFPLAYATTSALGLNFMPFAVAITLAASAGFATPFGYQTHLMVYGPGGYRFADFLRVGLPLDVLYGAVAVAVIPAVWALR